MDGNISRQIAADKYVHGCIINVDEMSVDFDFSPNKILCWIGERTVSSVISRHSSRCTITASGVKLPASAIWKMFWVGGLIIKQNSVCCLTKGLDGLVNSIGMEVDFIPAAYIACLQVMNKGLHKPFKQYWREESVRWLMNHQEGQKPSRVDITNWIFRSWDRVTISRTINTWGVTGDSSNRRSTRKKNCFILCARRTT